MIDGDPAGVQDLIFVTSLSWAVELCIVKDDNTDSQNLRTDITHQYQLIYDVTPADVSELISAERSDCSRMQ